MTSAITCSKCRSPMQKGFVLDRADYNQPVQPTWVEGEVEKSFWSGLKTAGRRTFSVVTYRCPQCGYLEFYTAEEIYI